jgi:hypothetical protein
VIINAHNFGGGTIGFGDEIVLLRGPSGVVNLGSGGDGTYIGGMGVVADTGEGGAEAFEFRGNHAIDCGSIGDLGTNYVAAGWAKFDSLAGQDIIIGYRTDTESNLTNVPIQLDRSGSNVRLIVRGSDNVLRLAAGGSVSIGTWHLIVGVRAGDNLSVYLDGLLVGSSSDPIGPVLMSRLTIGTIYNDVTNTIEFTASKMDGLLDDIRIRPSITAEQISDWYAAGRGYNA